MISLRRQRAGGSADNEDLQKGGGMFGFLNKKKPEPEPEPEPEKKNWWTF